MIKKIITVFFSVFLLCGSFTTITVKSAPACWPFLSSDPDFPLEKDGDVFLIDDVDDLLYMKCLVNGSISDETALYANASYRLTADIDMSGITDWEPIGNTYQVFSGAFDGDNHSIVNLTLTYTSDMNEDYHVGLFGRVESATIENVVLERFDYDLEVAEKTSSPMVYRTYYIGVLAAKAFASTFNNVIVDYSSISLVNLSNEANYSSFYVGGLLGSSERVVIDNVSLNVDLSVSNAEDSKSIGDGFIGGIVGYAPNTSIKNTYYFGEIDVASNIGNVLCVGGLSGFIIKNSYKSSIEETIEMLNNTVRSNITIDSYDISPGEYFVGGLFGFSLTNSMFSSNNQVVDSTIHVSLVSNLVMQEVHVGGLIGQASNLTMFRDKFDGNVITFTKSNRIKVGGLIGTLDQNSTIEQSFSIGSIESSLEHVAMIGGIVGELTPLDERSLVSDDSENNDFRIKNVYSKMNVDVLNNSLTSGRPLNIGGLVGLSSLNLDEITTLETSYFAGMINTGLATATKVNPLINNFYPNPFTYNSLYYDSSLIESETDYGEGKSTVEMKNAETFENFDFDYVWARLDDFNDGYPELRWGRYVTTFKPNNSNEPFYSFGYQSLKPKVNPLKENFEFIGWRTVDSSSNYDFNQVLNQDLMLTAFYLSNPTTAIQAPDLFMLQASNMLDYFTFTDQERENAVTVKLILSLLDTLNEKESGLVNQFLQTLENPFEKPTYLDISLFKVIGQQEQRITSVSEPIGISFILPEAYRQKSFVFLHIHEEVVKNVPYEYDSTTFEVTFSTKDFSSFVLLSQQQEIEEEGETQPELPVENEPEQDEKEEQQVENETVEENTEKAEEELLLPDTSDSSHINMAYLLLLGMLLVLASYKKTNSIKT